ncbi:HIT family protein [Siphonobacter aquaeclarae]|uniref:Histidine triad (HIT) family protein n=1 Tax=Siphonobacter aquaeclarae TaxID=563176 RepID=A0A1G9W952_9BACT|nr:HIT family protein [Siphonobacter aquaeclarae]SDM80736.1 histidine triad (HIT) family protein [Siphonobacter aquaeclarae]
MPSIFTRIIQGEIPCHKVAEDDRYLAFLDISPLTEGHTLVIPKKEVDYVFDLDDATLSGLILFAKKIAPAIQKACPCVRLGVSVIGLEVPHAHVHLIPMNSMRDVNFANPKLSLSQEQLAVIAARIRSYLD